MPSADDWVPVVDLFAGPGGLGEGFAASARPTARPRFRIAVSIEKDPAAHRTLELRAFAREFPHKDPPGDYHEYLRRKIDRTELFARPPRQADAARREAFLATLGEKPAGEVDQLIRDALSANPWVLIGGPPCQAYSPRADRNPRRRRPQGRDGGAERVKK